MQTTKCTATVGPCYQEGWLCPQSHLPCFKDCCMRGVAFCNHNEERCQTCETREEACGNDTMPWECDAYCLRKSWASTHTGNDCQMTQEVIAIIGLALLSTLLAVILIVTCYSCTKKPRFSRSSSSNSSNRKSASGSLPIWDQSPTSGSSVADDQDSNITQTAALLDEPEHTNATSTTINPPLPLASLGLHCLPEYSLQNQEMSQLLGQLPYPGDSSAVPASDTGQQYGLSCSAQQTGYTSDRGRHTAHVSQLSQSASSTPLQPPATVACQTYPSLHRQACRDPRLDNIPPSRDVETSVLSVHTGMAPFCEGLVYSTDN